MAMARIWPIVIYPFRHPADNENINSLYHSLDQADKTQSDQYQYEKPITVVNRQTYYRNKNEETFESIYEMIKAKSTVVVDAWCVDTCQMWLAGFGFAYDNSHNAEDIFWLIPGDFDYASDAGKGVLKKMYDMPENVMGGADFCIGQLEIPANSAKQLIDTYGTYGLLFNWFPAKAAAMRKRGIEHPRSEFFAIHGRFLRSAIDNRWFAYEQTIALLLQAGERPLKTVTLGRITNSPEGRDTLPGALQQIERTDRVLKVAWRDQQIRDGASNWVSKFRLLEEQSRQIIGAATTILEKVLLRT